ncbi:MAG TPA: peptide ABC transporter substrate-binding protein [Dehalococcoidia bacterium]|nr:peptide ABC transporter substrate-binding protein [Dehalococcoidia bacterium]
MKVWNAMEIRNLGPAKWFVAFVVAFGLLLAACAADNEPGSDSGSTDVSKAPASEQVLRLRIQGEPKTIDPQLTDQASEISVARALFSGLFSYDEDLTVIPNLAVEMPSIANGGISEDGLTYTIKLNPDAMWSDGQPVTAQDFVYSMKRALDPNLAGPYAAFFYSLAGAAAYNSALGTPEEPLTPSEAEIASMREGVGVSAKDDHTVVYQLTQSNPSFLNLLALWTAFPVRQDIVEKYGDTWTEAETLVGNGAFMLSEWTHGERMVLQPNPHWFGEAPSLTRIEFYMIEDDVAAYQAYKADEIDVVRVPPAALEEVSGVGSSFADQLTIEPELATYGLFMNYSTAPFDNELVRKAFGTAIDRDAYVNGVLAGGGVPTTSWIPPGQPGYNAEIGSQYNFDASKAKQLLADAGFADGAGLPEITFTMVNSDTNRIVGQFVQEQLKQNLGVDVGFEYVELKEYFRIFGSREHQIVIQRWSADWPYPDNWLPDLFTTGTGSNFDSYSNSSFDALMLQAAAETEDAKRLALYDQAHKLLVDGAGMIGLYNPVTYVLVKPDVKNYVITGLDGYVQGDLNFHRVYIAGSSN